MYVHVQNVIYNVHVHVITLDRNKIWARDLYLSTALIEAAKSLAPSNVKGHDEVPYLRETSAKVYGMWHIIYIAQCAVPTPCEWNIQVGGQWWRFTKN